MGQGRTLSLSRQSGWASRIQPHSHPVAALDLAPACGCVNERSGICIRVYARRSGVLGVYEYTNDCEP